MEAEDIASLRGLCTKASNAKAHEVFAKLCPWNADSFFMDEAAIESRRGTSKTFRVENDQAVLVRFCVQNSVIVGLDLADIAASSGESHHSRFAKAQAVFAMP